MTYASLLGKVAVVTGGGRGIGKAIAHTLANVGAKVVIAEINEVKGREVVKDLIGKGHQAHFIKTDVTSSDSVKRMVEETVNTFGKLDVAVNNAATQPDSARISDLEETTWTKIIDTNLSGVAFCLKWELQQMIKQGRGGSIINISSVTALRPTPMLPAYTVAKQGIVALTTIAATENGCHGIRVNVVAPGATRTDMLADSLAVMGLKEDVYAESASLLKRVAEPEEIAEGVLWLASDKSSFVTGTVMPVDGGYTIM